jgi:GNAT superfamily N-acetyltransferase
MFAIDAASGSFGALSGYPSGAFSGYVSPMNRQLLIRPAQQDDLQDLLDLYGHLDAQDVRCSPKEAIAVFSRFVLYPGSAILIGMIGRDLVASCTVVIIPNLTRGGNPYALIENVVTHPDYRNRGFGKAILNAATERAWIEGCYKVMLMTGSKKPSTIAFYEAAGFEQTKTGFQIRRQPVQSE